MTKEQIRQARRVNLADYLLYTRPSEFKEAGQCIFQRNKTSLYIKRSVPGYMDFSSNEHGNSIDFLTRRLGFSFPAAVMELCRFSGQTDLPAEPNDAEKTFTLPDLAPPPYYRVYAYLTMRGIPEKLISRMIREGILYQDAPYGNAVFVSSEKDYCEIRGTGSKPFHGCRKKRPDRFWCISNSHIPVDHAYICEAAIDAVSLLLLHERQGIKQPAVYISIGGVANQKTIDHIKRRIPTTLAVDNDVAGDACRNRNKDLPFLIPEHKDWNDDLRALSAK